MKVFVTGASGRVGRVVSEYLISDGHSVVGYDKAPPSLESPVYTHFQGEFDNFELLNEAMEGTNAVFHLGAYMSWFPDQEEAVFNANVNGTYTVLRAAFSRRLERFIFASTGEVYPEGNPVYLPLDEHHPLRPTSLYGLTKQMGEDMVWFYSRKEGIPAVVLRFPHIQSVEELTDQNSFFSGPRFFLRAKIRQMERMGNENALKVLRPLDDGTEKLVITRGEDGKAYRMMICDTRDLAEGVCLALENPRAVGENIGITPNRSVGLDEIVKQMSRETGLPYIEACLPGPRVDYFTSNLKAKELLGFEPRHDIAEMVSESCALWRRKRGLE